MLASDSITPLMSLRVRPSECSSAILWMSSDLDINLGMCSLQLANHSCGNVRCKDLRFKEKYRTINRVIANPREQGRTPDGIGPASCLLAPRDAGGWAFSPRAKLRSTLARDGETAVSF